MVYLAINIFWIEWIEFGLIQRSAFWLIQAGREGAIKTFFDAPKYFFQWYEFSAIWSHIHDLVVVYFVWFIQQRNKKRECFLPTHNPMTRRNQASLNFGNLWRGAYEYFINKKNPTRPIQIGFLATKVGNQRYKSEGEG